MPGERPAGSVSPSGLARLWRSSRPLPVWAIASAAAATLRARKCEDIEHASCRGLAWKVLHRVDEAQGAGRVLRVQLSRHDRSRPAADTGNHRNVLAAVRPAIADRLADDPA